MPIKPEPKATDKNAKRSSNDVHPLESKSRFPNIPFAPSRCPFHYGWFILVAGTLGIIVSAPGQTIGVSAFVEPLISATGLDRTAVSMAYGIGTLISAMLLTYGGRLYDQIGARKSAALAALVMGLTLIALSSLETLATAISDLAPPMTRKKSLFALLVPGFLLLRFSGQGMLTMVSRNMVMKWFVHRRGLANGIMGVFVGLSFSFSPRVFNRLIETFTWQTTWRILGLLAAVLFVAFVLVFYRDNPGSCGLTPDGGYPGRPDDPCHKPKRDYLLREAVRTWPLWIFTLALSMQSLYGTAFAFHIESIMAGAGFDSVVAYRVFFPTALISVTLGLAAGWISDHVRLNRLLGLHLTGMAISMIGLLIQAHQLTFALIVLGNGLASAMFGVLMGVTWPRFFGSRHLGEISGFNMTFNVLFSAIGPAFFALSIRFTEGYRAAILCCLVAVAVLAMQLPKAVRPSE